MLTPLLLQALVGCAAPQLTVSPPHLPAAGTAVYGITVQGGPVEVAMLIDGVEVATAQVEQSGELSIDTTTLADGEHAVGLETRSMFKGTARHDVTLVVDNTAPQLVLGASSATAAQGRTLGIFVQADEQVNEAQVTFLGSTWDLEKLPGHLLRGVKGIPVGAKSGTLPLTVRVVDDADNEAVATWSVTITETAFPRGGYVRLSTQKKKDMGKEQLTKHANEARWNAYMQDLGLPLVDGPMVKPAKGRITSRFGKVRRYNTGVVRHHLGTDMWGKAGDPVVAAHAGTVTLAEELHIYGNAVILKHGPNVSTSYNHLSQITVDSGQEVTQGMMIGRIGSSGQSTGPHLHWGLEVGGTAVAPEEWTTRDFSQPLPGDFEPGQAPDPALLAAPGPAPAASEEATPE
jgi:murein DD-endopeptidase MepM/ murein hydrolase activator NlpD